MPGDVDLHEAEASLLACKKLEAQSNTEAQMIRCRLNYITKVLTVDKLWPATLRLAPHLEPLE